MHEADIGCNSRALCVTPRFSSVGCNYHLREWIHDMNPTLDPEPENRTHIFMVITVFIQHDDSVCLVH